MLFILLQYYVIEMDVKQEGASLSNFDALY